MSCDKVYPALMGLPDDVFYTEDEYLGNISTVGDLGNAYLENTTSLRLANNKLLAICVAAERCKPLEE